MEKVSCALQLLLVFEQCCSIVTRQRVCGPGNGNLHREKSDFIAGLFGRLAGEPQNNMCAE